MVFVLLHIDVRRAAQSITTCHDTRRVLILMTGGSELPRAQGMSQMSHLRPILGIGFHLSHDVNVCLLGQLIQT